MLDGSVLAGVMGMLPDPMTVTVNFKNRTAPVSVIIDGARRRPISASDIAWTNMAGLGIPTAQFLLPVNQLGGNILKQGDEILESGAGGSPWNVLRADLEMQGTIYRAYVSQE